MAYQLFTHVMYVLMVIVQKLIAHNQKLVSVLARSIWMDESSSLYKLVLEAYEKQVKLVYGMTFEELADYCEEHDNLPPIKEIPHYTKLYKL